MKDTGRGRTDEILTQNSIERPVYHKADSKRDFIALNSTWSEVV